MLGTLLVNGVSLIPALSIIREAVGNLAVLAALDGAAASARAGAGLARPLEEAHAVMGMTPALLARLRPHLTVFTDEDPDMSTRDPLWRARWLPSATRLSGQVRWSAGRLRHRRRAWGGRFAIRRARDRQDERPARRTALRRARLRANVEQLITR